jgi:hypothetical protein
MATTTNYSWTTPDDTALVKDGAAAIRTLGSSADTTVKGLNPGTTSGDLDYYTSSTAKARIAIGTNGQVLTSNGSVPSWATPSSGGMTLISTTTLTGASITLSSIPQTYNHLQLVIQNYKPAFDGGNVAMRFNADAGANRHATVNTINASNGSFASTRVSLSTSNDNSVATGLAITNIYNYTNTATWKFCQSFSIGVNATTTTNYNFDTINGGLYNQTTAISSLELFDPNGNMTSGTVLLYGVK